MEMDLHKQLEAEQKYARTAAEKICAMKPDVLVAKEATRLLLDIMIAKGIVVVNRYIMLCMQPWLLGVYFLSCRLYSLTCGVERDGAQHSDTAQWHSTVTQHSDTRLAAVDMNGIVVRFELTALVECGLN